MMTRAQVIAFANALTSAVDLPEEMDFVVVVTDGADTYYGVGSNRDPLRTVHILAHAVDGVMENLGRVVAAEGVNAKGDKGVSS